MSDFSLLQTLPAESAPGAAEELRRIEPGTLIGGAYRVIGALGSGAMGVVLLAQDESLDRHVAIKFIHSALLHGEFQERFTSEARAMARISHPNVMPIYAFGDHENAPYFVMEFVEGQTLEQWIARSGGFPDVDLAVQILDGVCSGLEAIHAADTVHRDLKPGNILLDGKLRPRIADLGLAMLYRDDATARHELVGTPAYMAPEIAFSKEYGPAALALSDVYSLACVAYELLTGRPPHGSEGLGQMGLILQHRIGHVTAPSHVRPGLSAEIDGVVLRALAKNPAERTPSVEAFHRELLAAHSGSAEPVRILLADDHDDFRGSLEIILGLEFPGAEIECVGDGVKALAAFDRKRPSVTILDLQMPGLDGMQLTALLRERDPEASMPIIVLTASGGPKEWATLAAMGADRFFVKPVVVEDVVAMVRRCLKERSNRPSRVDSITV